MQESQCHIPMTFIQMLTRVSGIKESRAKRTCIYYKLEHSSCCPQTVFSVHMQKHSEDYDKSTKVRQTWSPLWRAESWLVGVPHLLFPLHVSTVQSRAPMIFKSCADSSQPWDLAGRVSTWVIFSVPLSMYEFIFPRQDFILLTAPVGSLN